jgi:hypothetical protein
MLKTDTPFLSFLRSTLKGESASKEVVQSLDWSGLMHFAAKQAIVGMVFEGVKLCRLQYPELVEKKVLMKWFYAMEKKRHRFGVVNQRILELTEMFGQAGFRTCILKGQGLAQMYPVVESRTVGDIDIWVEGERKAITDFVHSKTPGSFEQYHHIDFPIFKDIAVEVHYRPSRMNNPWHNNRLQNYYQSRQMEQFSNQNPLLGEHVCTPTKSFNAIFLLSHMMSHFYNEGIGLRQFIDYYYLLNQGFTDDEKKEFCNTARHLGMKKFAGAVMWIEENVLGLDHRYLLMPPNEKAGRFLAEETFETGNFGHLDTRYTFREHGAFATALTDIYRDILMARMFPSEAMWKPVAKIFNQRWKIRRFWK